MFKKDHRFAKTASIFSIDNVAYQGSFMKDAFDLSGLAQELFSIAGVEYSGKISFMKAGEAFCGDTDSNTVSETYSREILKDRRIRLRGRGDAENAQKRPLWSVEWC